jgi:putative endonuclease
MDRQYYVYILASKRNGTLYIGITGNLAKRIWKHKRSLADGFTKKYPVQSLVYYEIFRDVREAIRREKTPKKWRRAWKVALIESANRAWQDLAGETNGTGSPLSRG